MTTRKEINGWHLLHRARDWFIHRKVTWTCILNVRMRIITNATYNECPERFRSIFWGFRISKSVSRDTNLLSDLRDDNPQVSSSATFNLSLYKKGNWNEKNLHSLWHVNLFTIPTFIFDVCYRNCYFYQIVIFRESRSRMNIIIYILVKYVTDITKKYLQH